jgi:hypothetical protein
MPCLLQIGEKLPILTLTVKESGHLFLRGRLEVFIQSGRILWLPVPSPNEIVYTVHPADGRHLGWSVLPDNRSFAVSEMIRAGLNTAVMSYWGEPDTDRWRFWAPMQTSTEAHNQLFTEAVNQNLLIMPAIEAGAKTNHSSAFIFADEFPPEEANICTLTHQICGPRSEIPHRSTRR